MYSSAWGFPVDARIHQQDNILIGHLSIDSGVIDWKSWNEADGGGLVWNGVCETFLGARISSLEFKLCIVHYRNPPITYVIGMGTII